MGDFLIGGAKHRPMGFQGGLFFAVALQRSFLCYNRIGHKSNDKFLFFGSNSHFVQVRLV
jgi:hypothetical protein